MIMKGGNLPSNANYSQIKEDQNEKYYFKTTFTAIAALFFATSLYATDMKS